MQDGAPSFTALGPALLRAVHQVLDDSPRILTDPVAVGFIDGSSEREILANREGFQSSFLKALLARISFCETATPRTPSLNRRRVLVNT